MTIAPNQIVSGPNTAGETVSIHLNAEQKTLMSEVRAWLADHAPKNYVSDENLDARVELLRDWQRRLYEAGWLGMGWPREYGGEGGGAVEKLILNRELVRARAPLPVGIIGLEIVGPVILQFGTESQKLQFIPPLLSGDEMWCQGFSEPNAGSDLAALRTRAQREGDYFIVSGHKVWTSWAQYAQWCALLVRTDTKVPKHRGITYLLARMDSAGVETQPLTQITGDAEFNEVFFDEVRVSKENVLGALNDGWKLALATLAFERGPYIARRQTELRIALDDLLLEVSRLEDSGELPDKGLWSRLSHCEVLMEVMEAQTHRTLGRAIEGDFGAENSIDKLFLTEVEQEVFAVGLDILGAYRSVSNSEDDIDRGRWIHDYLYSRAASIYGGTSEIQRGIIAERLLSLPRAT